MKKIKVINAYDFPEEFQDELYKKKCHCGGSCSWYPGEAFFKPLSEVKDINNILFLPSETKDTPDVYVYEKGDDVIGDWLMDNHGVGLCEEILIK